MGAASEFLYLTLASPDRTVRSPRLPGEAEVPRSSICGMDVSLDVADHLREAIYSTASSVSPTRTMQKPEIGPFKPGERAGQSAGPGEVKGSFQASLAAPRPRTRRQRPSLRSYQPAITSEWGKAGLDVLSARMSRIMVSFLVVFYGRGRISVVGPG